MKVASWNVNSYNVRKQHINNFLIDHNIDILLLQETRCSHIELDANISNYYKIIHNPATKGRNGVAIISKIQLTPLELNIFPDRIVAAQDTQSKKLFVSVYAPNGGSKLSPVSLKVELFNFLIDKFHNNNQVVMGGDFNVVKDPEYYMHSHPYEQQSIDALTKLEQNFFSAKHNYKKYITWCDYRDYKNTKGMGLDRFFLGWPCANPVFIVCSHWKAIKHSDHVPIILDL